MGEPDIDFFENMRHVQKHRRGRALTRLSTQLKEDPNYVSEKNLVQLILPLASCYLAQENDKVHYRLVEQAIEFLGSVCKVMSWSSYAIIMKYYLSLFKKEKVNQKQLVKIIMVILESFHFPLNYEEDNLTEKEAKLRKKIHGEVNSSMLPALVNMLAGKTKGKLTDSARKSKQGDDGLIIRVPLAVPLVKILQLNSQAVVEQHIPGILAKIASFLKSKLIEVRIAARTTLNCIAEILGPRFVSFIIQDLSCVLTRGYQVHVLNFSVHELLLTMMRKNLLQPGHLDTAINMITEMSINEMFSVTAEEKEVQKIVGKLMEAKNIKSYDTLQITAKFISTNQIINLVKPFSEKLKQFSTHKNISKIKECLRNIALGLIENSGLEPMIAITFIYAVLTDSLDLGHVSQTQKSEVKKKVGLVEKPDTYIIQPEPQRGGSQAKHTAASSQHILQEFGLNLFYFILKQGNVEGKNEEHCARINPFYEIMFDCLDSPHPTVISVTLRCFLWVVKLPLEARTNDSLLRLTNKVFKLLKRYGAGTDCKGENKDLVNVASKLLVVMIRDVNLTQIEDDQLSMIFDYTLIDIMDPMKQATAFKLLDAIIRRKIEHKDLHNLIMKLVELSIQSKYYTLRNATRNTIVNYAKHYNLGEARLATILDFYTAQLRYKDLSGNLAAAECLKSLITSIGPARLNAHVQCLFVSMVPQLINAESEETRKAVADCISTLLSSIHTDSVATLLRSTMAWFNSESSAQVQLATRIFVIFVDSLGLKVLKSEQKNIIKKLTTLSQSSDGQTIQTLMFIQRVARSNSTNSILKNSEILDVIERSILHSHSWIRLLAAQLLGLYLTQAENCSDFCWLQKKSTLKAVTLDTVEQLNMLDSGTSDLGTQIVKNLIALTKLVTSAEVSSTNHQEESEETSTSEHQEDMEQPQDEEGFIDIKDYITLKFVLKKVIRVSNTEMVKNARDFTRRTLVFNYLAAVFLHSSEYIQEKEMLNILMLPIVRTVESPQTKINTEIKDHAQEVLNLIKAKTDDTIYNKTLLNIQQYLSDKRGDRNLHIKQNYIKDPEAAAKRKLQKKENKNLSKKARY